MHLSARKNNYVENGWKEYYIKRFDRVLIPYLIVAVPYEVWNAMFESYGSLIRRFMVFGANISSAAFWLKGTQTTWYLHAIVVFYLLFPVLYGFLQKSSKTRKVALIAGLIVMAAVFSYLPILRYSIDAWARLPIFSIGIIYGLEDKKQNMSRVSLFVSILVILVIGGVTSASELVENFPLELSI